jgi:hypothetical protein
MNLMELDLPWVPILLATASVFVLGGLWYSPVLFLRPWLAANGFQGPQSSHPVKVFGGAIVFSLLGAILFHYGLGESCTSAVQGAKLGALVGGGLVVTSLGINYMFSGRKFALLLIDGGYHCVQWTLVGAIYGWQLSTSAS